MAPPQCFSALLYSELHQKKKKIISIDLSSNVCDTSISFSGAASSAMGWNSLGKTLTFLQADIKYTKVQNPTNHTFAQQPGLMTHRIQTKTEYRLASQTETTAMPPNKICLLL